MPYGIQIRTTTGVKEVADVNSARVVRSITITNTSGSASVPEFSTTRGEYIVVNENTGSNADRIPKLTWNEGAKTFTWSRPSNYPLSAFTNRFTVYFLEYF